MTPVNSVPFNDLFITNSAFVFKIGVVAFAFMYFIFTLVVIRQVNLMTETVRTQAAPLLKLFSFLYALFALAVVVFFFLVL